MHTSGVQGYALARAGASAVAVTPRRPERVHAAAEPALRVPEPSGQ